MEQERMKKILVSMIALSAVSIGTPGVAQYQNGSSPNRNGNYQNQNGFNAGGDVSARISRLQARIQEGVQSGAISRQDAGPLRAQARQLAQLERRYSANGFNGQERADLQQRIRTLRQQVRVADGGRQRGYDQDDRDDYGQNGRTDRSNREGQGYEDRDYSRNGRPDDRDYNRDGRSDDLARDGGDQQPAQRGGLGGLLDSVLGRTGSGVGQ
jgi:hypothetical protein